MTTGFKVDIPNFESQVYFGFEIIAFLVKPVFSKFPIHFWIFFKGHLLFLKSHRSTRNNVKKPIKITLFLVLKYFIRHINAFFSGKGEKGIKMPLIFIYLFIYSLFES